MERYTDFTPEQLLDKTDEEIAHLIDIECAYRGVALLPDRPVAPDEPEGKPDVTVWDIAGHLFRDKEDAEKVADVLNSLPVLETYSVRTSGNYWSGPFGVRTDVDFSISPKPVQHWTEEHYDVHRRAFAEYEEAKSRYSQEKKEFDRIAAEREGIVEEIAEIRMQASRDRAEREEVKRGFQRYLDLAEGDKAQALKFFLHGSNYEEDFVRDVLDFPLDTQAEA